MSKPKTLFQILLIALIASTVMGNQFSSFCPVYRSGQTIHSNTITASFSSKSEIAFDRTKESQCFDYSLPVHFQKEPKIAISLQSFIFSSEKNTMFFSVKPIISNNFGVLKFVLRTQWSSTNWTKIGFGFLATDRNDIEAGYLQVDTGSLAANCSAGKNVNFNVPLKLIEKSDVVNVVAFLHGFQIASSEIDGKFTAIELNITSISCNGSVIQITLAVKSETVVHSAFVSYVAITQQTKAQIENYFFDSFKKDTNSFYVQRRSYKRFHGISEIFIPIPNGKNQTSFDFRYLNSENPFYFGLQFKGQPRIFILYSYILFQGNSCQNCPGNNFLLNNQCVEKCPSGTYFDKNQQICLFCKQPRKIVEDKCVDNCDKQSQFFDQKANKCRCKNPQMIIDEKGYCICPEDRAIGKKDQKCECKYGPESTNKTCGTCPGQLKWDFQLKNCECLQPNSFKNGQKCIVCFPGQSYNINIDQCQCPSGKFWNKAKCISCPNNQSFDSNTNQCTCPQGRFWNGYSCLSCPSGKIWSQNANNCECPYGTIWNGFSCSAQISICSNGRVWNSFTNQCVCPSGQIFYGNSCAVQCSGGKVNIGGQCYCPQSTFWNGNQCTSCGNGQMFNGITCVPISCPPGSLWDGKVCVYGGQCPPNHQFNGKTCELLIPQCPPNTSWNGNTCHTEIAKCPQGSYFSDKLKQCARLPSQCPQNTQWNGYSCIPVNNTCPHGSFFNGNICIPFQGCSNGQIWNVNLCQCVCPDSSYWNGLFCVGCGFGKIYSQGQCRCPEGLYWIQQLKTCDRIKQFQKCQGISNSNWNGFNCECRSGFQLQGNRCVCRGLDLAGICDKCFYKPHSVFYQGICKCRDGFIDINNQCMKKGTFRNGNQTQNSCQIAQFYDSNQRICLPCPNGCIKCSTSYKCDACSIDYNYNHQTYLCDEICGDGKRFVVQCDDGNNFDGDGCSKDCKIEKGFVCSNGSPQSKDLCLKQIPKSLVLSVTGVTRLYAKIILNVKANYLPDSLTPCSNEPSDYGTVKSCSQILDVTVRNADSVLQTKNIIKSIYANSFGVQVQFKAQPIPIVNLEVKIKQQVRYKFPQGINTEAKITIQVNPAHLALYEHQNRLADDILQ